ESVHIIKDNLFAVPPLFRIIQEESQTSWQEMYQVFNMGHRLEIYISEEYAHNLISIAAAFNIPAQIVGRVEESDTNRLTLTSPFGQFTY
ncbi:MAG: phosphoribosylformylglycinamidine cyclo-ligase, partial [Cytophagales bacterium CG18_big_fil_WC_8_21_14_2_50_42_9]